MPKSKSEKRGKCMGFVGGADSAGSTQMAIVTPTPIPELAAWETNMTTAGLAVGDVLIDPGTSAEDQLAACYYDAQYVYLKIAAYTGDNSWLVYANHAKTVYRDDYLLTFVTLPGYWAFPDGLLRHYQLTNDPTSLTAITTLSDSTSYANDLDPSVTAPAELSREVAYLIRCFLAGERVGQSRKARLGLFVTQALDHIDQWCITEDAPYVRPFMVAITAHGLISYEEDTHDARILPQLIIAADWIWDNCWVPASEAFKYTDRYVSDPADEDPAPDLNLLIAPMYAWLWRQTGYPRFLTRGDEIFAGGVTGAWLGNGKQFNQNYVWSFDYVNLRLGGHWNSL